MKNILFIQSSPRGVQSASHQAAQSVIGELKIHYPDAKVVLRDLSKTPRPHIGEAFVGGLAARPEQQTTEQAMALALSDALISELVAADIVVLAAPMHNFTIPSILKAWLDHVVRAGQTFAYTQNGPKGLLEGKRAILVLSRGGIYSDGPTKPFDYQEPYLRAILGFIGITAVHVVRVEGVAMSAIGPEKALAAATTESKQLIAPLT